MKSTAVIYVFTWSLSFLTTIALACDERVSKYKTECEIQDRYQNVKEQLLVFGVDVETIAQYRALRFISQKAWDSAKSKSGITSNPWNIYEPKPATWLYWESGADFINSWESLGTVKKENLSSLHKSVIDLSIMRFWSIVFKGAKPGRIRSSVLQMAPSFTVSCEGKEINKEQAAILKKYDLKDRYGMPLVSTTLYPCNDIYDQVGIPKDGKFKKRFPNSPYFTGSVIYTASALVPGEIKKWLKDLNALLNSNEVESKLSPLEKTADLQRRFVAIHPFGDGNGRTSRLVQDFISKKLGLPFANSGSLQGDLVTPTESYRKSMIQATWDSLWFLESCLKEYKLAVSESNLQVSAACLPTVPNHQFDMDDERIQDKEKFQKQLTDFLNRE